MKKGVKRTIAQKGARLFAWLREQSDFSTYIPSMTFEDSMDLLDDLFKPEPVPETEPTQGTVQEPELQPIAEPAVTVVKRDSTRYEEQLLQILLDGLQEAKQLPSTEMLAEIKALIASVKENDMG